MLGKLARWAFRRAVARKVRVLATGPDGLAGARELLENLENACVVTTPSAWSQFTRTLEGTPAPARLIQDPPLQLDTVRARAGELREEHVVGIGGGRAVDSAKALARLSGKRRCTLVPTILSTTAWLNATASLKDGARVVHQKGGLDQVVVIPDVVAAAPQHLNVGGVADLLCGYNALADWTLAAREGAARLLKRATREVRAFLDALRTGLEAHLPVTPASVPFLARAFLAGMRTCWSLMSGRPVEGSEHFVYYALEETHDAPMNHGGVIALATLACLRLRDSPPPGDAFTLRAWYAKVGIRHTLHALDLPAEVLARTLRAMPDFVRARDLPFSWWNVADPFQHAAVDELVEWLA